MTIAPDAFTTEESGSDYFASEIHHRAFAERIVSAVHDDRRFIVVTGDPSPDPLTLSASLNEVLDDQQAPVMLLTSGPEFRANALANHDLAAQEGSSNTQPTVPRLPMLIFDDAEQLADEQIVDIYEKSRSVDRWLVVMLGRSDLLVRLERLEFHFRWDEHTTSLSFDELGRREILAYIRHQIGTGESARAFTDDAIAVMWSLSRGDPRIVDRLARRLLDGARQAAERADPEVPSSPAAKPAHKTLDYLLADPDTPVVPPETSLEKPKAAAAQIIPAAVPPSAQGDNLANQLARRFPYANTQAARAAVWLQWSLPVTVLTDDTRNQLSGPNAATPPAEPEAPRNPPEVETAASARTVFFGPTDEDAQASVPAWPESVPWPPPPAASPASVVSERRHTRRLLWPIIAVALCLIGLGLAGTVVLKLRGDTANPVKSDHLVTPIPAAPIQTANPEPNAIQPPAAPPMAALPPNPVPASPAPPVAVEVQPPNAASPATASPEPNTIQLQGSSPTEPQPPAAPPVVGALPPGPAPASPAPPVAAEVQPPNAASPATASPEPNTLQPSAPSAAAPTAPPVAALPPGPALTSSAPPSVDEIAELVKRGDALLGTGDVSSARLFYERSADAGSAEAALRLGQSFDPDFLRLAHIRGVQGDLSTAIFWYRRARELGSVEAEILLKSMKNN